MNRRKKIKVVIFISILSTSLILLYGLIGDSMNSSVSGGDYKININKLIRTIEPTCKCRKERVSFKLVDENQATVKISKDNTTLKSYNVKLSSLKLACSSYNSFRRGPGQKVISYSIYGTNIYYYRYIKLIAQTAKVHYPDWIVRFYHDLTFNPSFLCEIECLKDEENGSYLDNVDFCNIEYLPYDEIDFASIVPTFWRWFPFADRFVDVFLSRDSDFCVVERDRQAVDDWLQSGTLFHLMRDHPYHDIFMLAGLWGFRAEFDRALSDRLFHLIVNPSMKKWYRNNWRRKDTDQVFLEKYFRSIVEKNHTAHDSFFCRKYGGKPFPKPRPGYYCHVGGYGCCGPQFLNASFPHECTYECRPYEHKEWVFC